MATKKFKHVIEMECDEKDESLVKALADKYIFTGAGIRQLDDFYNNFNLMITPKVRTMIKAKR